MAVPTLSTTLVLTGLLAAFFAFGGVANLIGPRTIVEDFVRWGYPRRFHLVTGALELVTAALLLSPMTRMAGAVLAICIMGAAVATLVFHREYGHALPALVVIGLTVLLVWR